MKEAEFCSRIRSMQQTLYRVSYGILPRESDREDALQECILKAWQYMGRLRDERLFETWIVRILINECYAIGRKQRRLVLTDMPPEREAPPGADPALHEAILRLPDELRLPLMLHYIEGYRVQEIGTILRLPAGTVKSRLYRARQALKLDLGEEAKA